MLPKINLESIACPAPHHLHDLERNPSKQVLKHTPDPDAMTFDLGDTRSLRSFVDACHEGMFRERSQLRTPLRGTPCKYVIIFTRVINPEMSKKCCVGIREPRMCSPEDRFSLRGSLGGRDVENRDLCAGKSAILHIDLDVSSFYASSVIEFVDAVRKELSQTRNGPEYRCQTSENRYVKRVVVVELLSHLFNKSNGNWCAFLAFRCWGSHLVGSG